MGAVGMAEGIEPSIVGTALPLRCCIFSFFAARSSPELADFGVARKPE